MHGINDYVTKRYDRWLDYAKYHCARAGIPDEGIDVLNEVLCSLLQKDESKLTKMLNVKKNGYTELDFFVLRMIKLNATSTTSPYRNKYKPIPADANVDYSRLEVEDIEDDSTDKSERILTEMRLVREILPTLELSELAKEVFEFRFFLGEHFSEWSGPETLKELYDIYNGVQELVKKKINKECLF